MLCYKLDNDRSDR